MTYTGIKAVGPLIKELEETLPKAVTEDSRLRWLEETFDLAPELDLRYERLYAYLQDDVIRRRPSVDLALNLLIPSAEARLTNRTHFSPEAPLIRHNLVYLIADPQQISAASSSSWSFPFSAQLESDQARCLLKEQK